MQSELKSCFPFTTTLFPDAPKARRVAAHDEESGEICMLGRTDETQNQIELNSMESLCLIEI